MPSVLDLLILCALFEIIKSTFIFILTNALAKVNADKPDPNIQTLIIFLTI